MNNFSVTILDQPHAEPLVSCDKMLLLSDFIYTINGVLYYIPAGFIWDGASIPRPFWEIIGSPTEPKFWAFSLVHDWIYLTHIRTREEADEAAFQILGQCNVSLLRSRCIWAAVRLFGGLVGAWKTKPSDKKQIDEINAFLASRSDRYKFYYPIAG